MGASSRVRIQQYEPALHEAGYQIEFSPFFDDLYLKSLYCGDRKRLFGGAVRAYVRRVWALIKIRDFDVLWIEKELLPYLPGVIERWATSSGRPYIVDYDDAIFHNYDQHPSWVVRVLLGNRLDALLRGSAGVTAGNRYLSDYAKLHGAANVINFPTVVDTEVYRPIHTTVEHRPLTIGWIGSPSTRHILERSIPALNSASEKTSFRLQTVGISEVRGARFPVDIHPWTNEYEVKLLNNVDIGIMPLSDTPFERGKCGYKLIQYMACGKPVIASPVGVNVDIVTKNVGFLAETIQEWSDVIHILGNNPTLRAQMGAEGRIKVENHFSLKSNIPKLIRLLDKVTENNQS
jgi:glycosyltransferase involved in cell wall biosynthesis